MPPAVFNVTHYAKNPRQASTPRRGDLGATAKGQFEGAVRTKGQFSRLLGIHRIDQRIRLIPTRCADRRDRNTWASLDGSLVHEGHKLSSKNKPPDSG